MSRFRTLITRVHERSLWQTLDMVRRRAFPAAAC